jgi:hypothetical protein
LLNRLQSLQPAPERREVNPMKRLRVVGSAVLLTMWSGVATVGAAGGPLTPLSERIQGANAVVVATAVDVQGRWASNEHGDKLIVSRIVLRVDETLKGAAYSSRFVDIEGGTVGDLTLHVSSTPGFKPGERGVFMLDETGNSPVDKPHLRGLGVLKLDGQNRIEGSTMRLEDVRGIARIAR